MLMISIGTRVTRGSTLFAASQKAASFMCLHTCYAQERLR
jgi:hypothetical protein